MNGESSPANRSEKGIKPLNLRLRVFDKNWDQLFRDEHGDCPCIGHHNYHFSLFRFPVCSVGPGSRVRPWPSWLTASPQFRSILESSRNRLCVENSLVDGISVCL